MSLWAWHLFQFMPACKLLLSAQETGPFIFCFSSTCSSPSGGRVSQRSFKTR